MSLGSKVKFGFTSFLIAAAVITAGGFFLHDNRNTPGPNEDMFTFHAIFKPERRQQSLAVTIDLNGVRYKNSRARVSPWETILILPKGSKVKLEVWQAEGDTLECIIFRNASGVVQSFPNVITGPGGCVTRAG